MQQEWEYNHFFFKAPIELDTEKTPLDDEDVLNVFRRGHCGSFAVAASELLGGAQIVKMNDGDVHYAVEMDDGLWLDIGGIMDKEAMLEAVHCNYYDTEVEYVDREEVEDNHDLLGYRPEDAKPWAMRVLKEAGINV